MESCCIICHKVYSFPENEEDLDLYLELLERYLLNEADNQKIRLAFLYMRKLTRLGLAACQECLQSLKDFCNLFHEMDRIELILKWKLWRIRNIMEDSVHPSRTQFFEVVKSLKIPEPGDANFMDFKKELINLCSKKAVSSFPRLILQRIKPENVPKGGKLHDEDGLSTGNAICKDLWEETIPQLVIVKEESSQPINSSKTRSYKKKNRNVKQRKRKVLKFSAVFGILRRSIKILRRRKAKKNKTKKVLLGNREIKTEIIQPEQAKEKDPQEELQNYPFHEGDSNGAEIGSNQEDDTSNGTEEGFNGPENGSNGTEEEQSPVRRLRSVHKCNRCGKTFSTLASLTSHEKELCYLFTDDEDEDEVEDSEWSDSDEDEDVDEEDEAVEEVNLKVEGNDTDEENEINEKPKSKNPPTKRKRLPKVKDPSVKKRRHANPTPDMIQINCKTNRWHCPFCAETYRERTDLRFHIIFEHPLNFKPTLFSKDADGSFHERFKCPGCPRMFMELHWLLQHFKNCTEAKNGTIQVELQSFVVNPDLAIFKTFHETLQKPQNVVKIEVNPDLLFICKVKSCQRAVYSSEEDFQEHEKLHGEFKCGFCSKTFEYLPKLSVHEMEKHGSKVRKPEFKITCARCKETFNTHLKYMRHHISHFSMKFVEQSCAICRNYFAEIEQSFTKGAAILFKHYRLHHDLDKVPEPVRCTVQGCPAYFPRIQELHRHMLTYHELNDAELKAVQERKKGPGFVCEECGKRFREALSYNKHKLSHSGPESWEFLCSVCSKKCISKQKLEEHMRTHTKEKPFICEVCGAKYAHRHNLRIHVNSKHEVKDVARKFSKVNFTSRKGIKKLKL